MDDRLVCASVKMPRSLRFLLERTSETLGMSMSTIIRLAVSQALNNGIKDISQYAYETDEYIVTTFKVPLSVKKELKRMARANMVSASEIVRLSLVRLIRTLTPYEGGYVDVYETALAPAMPSVSIVVPAQGVIP
jgi:hypothetical protein